MTVAAPDRMAAAARVLTSADARAMALHAHSAGGRRGPARIVVIGEFNSGKTALVNALVGAPVLPASAVHHTPCPIVIGHAKTPTVTSRAASGERVPLPLDQIGQLDAAGARRLDLRLPLPNLKGLRIVDTPGFGLDSPEDEAAVLKICRDADLIIWCTPAFQAWKHSERVAWLNLPERARRQGVLAITFWEAVPDAADLDRLIARLHTDAGTYFRDIVLACSHVETAP